MHVSRDGIPTLDCILHWVQGDKLWTHIWICIWIMNFHNKWEGETYGSGFRLNWLILLQSWKISENTKWYNFHATLWVTLKGNLRLKILMPPCIFLLPMAIRPIKLLTHWGRVTHICVSKLTIIGSDNGLSPGRRQAIIWTSVGILSIGPLGANFSEILIGIYAFSFKKMHLKMSSAKWRPFCLGLNVLRLALW